MKTLEKLRDKLNKNAELSGQEKETNKIINKFLEKTNPDVHYKNVGGYGIIAVYKGLEEGKNILLRADIDGLNIPLMSTDNGQGSLSLSKANIGASTSSAAKEFNVLRSAFSVNIPIVVVMTVMLRYYVDWRCVTENSVLPRVMSCFFFNLPKRLVSVRNPSSMILCSKR